MLDSTNHKEVYMEKRFVSAGIHPINKKLFRMCYDRLTNKDFLVAEDLMDILSLVPKTMVDKEEVLLFIHEKIELSKADEALLIKNI